MNYQELVEELKGYNGNCKWSNLKVATIGDDGQLHDVAKSNSGLRTVSRNVSGNSTDCRTLVYLIRSSELPEAQVTLSGKSVTGVSFCGKYAILDTK